MKTPLPRLVDIITSHSCNQECRHCAYAETAQLTKHSTLSERRLLKVLIDRNPQTIFFIYPREITYASELIPFMKAVKQSVTLSNGKDMTQEFVKALLDAGINDLYVTLFSTAEEHTMFCHGSREDYDLIIKNIGMCVRQGMNVQVSNILTRETMYSIERIHASCADIGVNRLRFMRLRPTGNATTSFASQLYITASDLEKVIVPAVEHAKATYGHRVKSFFSLAFGPNLYGKSKDAIRQKIMQRLQRNTMCPAIGGDYCCISTASRNAYWCNFNVADSFSRIGFVGSDGDLTVDDPVDLSPETLRRRLRGICSSDTCDWLDVCLGGCRSAAIQFAERHNGEDRIYVGMDMCLTIAYSRYCATRCKQKQAVRNVNGTPCL